MNLHLSRRSLLLAGFGTIFGIGAAEVAPPIPPHTAKVLHALMVEQPPVIDGKMDDPCWKDAALADDFSLYKGVGWPTQKTDVRVAYDAENLYLFATMHEAQPDKILTPTPNQRRDNPVHGDDCLEVFIEKQTPGKEYFHLTVNAANVKYDAGPGSTSWNPVWQNATCIGRDAWYLEIAFPFRELTHAGDMAGTPPKGSEWRINFNRMERPANEMSNWSCTYMGFHEPKNFGHIFFDGRRNGVLPQVDAVVEGEKFFGANVLQAAIRNPAAQPVDVTARLALTLDGQPAAAEEKTFALTPGRVENLLFKYDILKGGAAVIALTATEKGQAKPFYAGNLNFRLPYLEKEIPAFAERLQQAVTDAQAFNAQVPGVPELKQRLQEQVQQLQEVRAAAARGTALPGAEWRATAAKFAALVTENKALLRKARLLTNYTRLSADGSKPQFYLSTASPLELVFEKELVPEPVKTAVVLSSAGHEYENFQIAIVPIFGDLKNVTVWPGDLRTTDGANWINARNISFRVVDPVYREKPWYFKGEDWPEWFPDILWPKTLFDVKENTQKAVWITVYTPAGTAPGSYSGRIAVHAAGLPPQYVSVTHRVWPFDLPAQPHLRSDPWFSTRELQRYYTLDQPVPLEMEIAYKEFISNYRLSSLGLAWVPHFAQSKLIKATVDGNGDFTYDFNGLLPYFQASFSRVTNSFNPNMGCNAELFGQIMGLKQALSKETGKPVDLEPAPKTEGEAFKLKRVRQFWTQYCAWLKEHGWLQAAMFEMVDEPNDESRRQQLRTLHTGMREIAPGMALFSFGPAPDTPGLKGYLDYWGPQLRHFSSHREAFLKEQAAGARFWLYSCEASYANDGETQHCPDSGVSDPPLERRIFPWFCFKWNIDGFLIFDLNTWDTWEEGRKMTADPARRWPLNGEKNVSKTDYQFIYPAPDGRPIASARLENLRDGMEDFEYLYLLRAALATLQRTGGEPALVREAEGLLNLEPDIAVHANNFVKDPAVLLARRNAIGDLLAKVGARAPTRAP